MMYMQNEIASGKEYGNSPLDKRGNLNVKTVEKSAEVIQPDFSIVDAVKGMLDPNYVSKSLELSQDFAERNGIKARSGSVIVPTIRADERQSTVDDSALVGEDHLAGSFISPLNEQLILKQAGAKVLTSLQGDIDIPRQSDSTTAYWVGEGDAPTNSVASFDSVKATPHCVAAYTDCTRRILIQSDPSIEQLVRNDLQHNLLKAVEYAAISGDGTGNAPKGILNTAGIGTVSGAVGSEWSMLIDMQTEVESANGNFSAYIVSPAMYGSLLQAPVVVGESRMVAEHTNGKRTLAGYPCFVSKALADNQVLGGGFSDLLMLEWGFMSLDLDPYSLSTSGGVRTTAFYDVDFVIRHPESFVLATIA